MMCDDYGDAEARRPLHAGLLNEMPTVEHEKGHSHRHFLRFKSALDAMMRGQRAGIFDYYFCLRAAFIFTADIECHALQRTQPSHACACH